MNDTGSWPRIADDACSHPAGGPGVGAAGGIVGPARQPGAADQCPAVPGLPVVQPVPGVPAEGPGLAVLVGRALTGEQVALPRVTAVPQIAAALHAAGWSDERLRAVRDARLAAGQRWPVPLSAAERGGIGAAQLHAAVQAVGNEFGLGPVVLLRDRHAQPTTRDRVLEAERPPHHGSVG